MTRTPLSTNGANVFPSWKKNEKIHSKDIRSKQGQTESQTILLKGRCFSGALCFHGLFLILEHAHPTAVRKAFLKSFFVYCSGLWQLFVRVWCRHVTLFFDPIIFGNPFLCTVPANAAVRWLTAFCPSVVRLFFSTRDRRVQDLMKSTYLLWVKQARSFVPSRIFHFIRIQ